MIKNTSRNSNIEIFRVITMLMIVAHHYVVNSGLLEIGGVVTANSFSSQSIFLFIFGMWGKIGINCFVFITGYFMCKSRISFRKFLKLLLQIEFYNITITLIFYITGYEQFTISGFIHNVLPITAISTNFISCYLIFYLLIPFLNILIEHLSSKQHLAITLLLVLVYSILDNFPGFSVSFNYVSWFVVIYFMASYIRMHPIRLLQNKKFVRWAFAILIVLCILSVIALNILQVKLNRTGLQYALVVDSNKFLALMTALFAFLTFKDLPLKNSKFINTVAASSFGVLLIHANSDAMRHWLWVDTLDNVGAYYNNVYLHAILSVVGVYAVCTLIDYLRIRFLERPFFEWYDRKNFKDPFEVLFYK